MTTNLDTPTLLTQYRNYLSGQKRMLPNSIALYLRDLADFLNYCTKTDVTILSMGRPMLSAYVADLATRDRGPTKTRGYARISIVRKITILRSFYNFLVQQKVFTTTPVPSARSFPVKTDKPLPSFLGRKEADRLMEAADNPSPTGLRDRAILELLYASGIRLSEAQRLDIDDVNIVMKRANVTGKGNHQRQVIFGQPAQHALERYLQNSRPHLIKQKSPEGPFFVNRFGNRLSNRSIQTTVKRNAERAGIRNNTHTHTLRHTFATQMIEGKTDIRVIQELLGHVSAKTTQIYTHITKTEARSAYMENHPMTKTKK